MMPPRYVVVNGNQLGRVYAYAPDTLWVDRGLVTRGGYFSADPLTVSRVLHPREDVREATREDFREFRVLPPPDLVLD